MEKLGYPLAKSALESIKARTQQLPYELQQVIMQNPEILNMVQQAIAGNLVPREEVTAGVPSGE